MSIATDFGVELGASLIGAFAGVFLALVAERRTRHHREAALARDRHDEFEKARLAVLGSVVKNTAESKRIADAVSRGRFERVAHAGLELSVWEAARDQFVALAGTVEERVLFARFFDAVRRLQSHVDFRRGLQTSIVTARLPRDDPELVRLLSDADERLHDFASDVRVTGMMLVSDFGTPVQRRMLGMETAAAPPAA